ELAGGAVALAREHVQDGGLEQRILVAETAIDRARREAGMGGNAGNGRSRDPMLAEHLDRRLEQFAQGFAAAGLLGLQGGLAGGLGHKLIVVGGAIRGVWKWSQKAAGRHSGPARWGLSWCPSPMRDGRERPAPHF